MKLVWLVFCLFWFNQNIETLCFGIEAKQPKQMFVSDSAETGFGFSFGCFVSKLVSKDTLDLTLWQRTRFKFDKSTSWRLRLIKDYLQCRSIKV